MSADDPTGELPFWKTKTLEEMDGTEWESLCDGCARCCLNKLEDWDTGEIVWTNVACTLLDCDSCRCRDYVNRAKTVPDCIQLTPDEVRTLTWLPPTCAYRLVRDGEDLPGGIRSFRVIPRRFIRPESRYAGGRCRRTAWPWSTTSITWCPGPGKARTELNRP
jgi:uncharacterized cysteine cluster protein YcgN (CxxCxxCC family)